MKRFRVTFDDGSIEEYSEDDFHKVASENRISKKLEILDENGKYVTIMQ